MLLKCLHEKFIVMKIFTITILTLGNARCRFICLKNI